MPYSVKKLITRAYYLSGIVSQSLQSVTGSQLSEGLDALNEVLSVNNIHGELIPYFHEEQFDLAAGQEKYSIDKLIHIETLTFNIGVVRYETSKKGRLAYFASARADNVKTLPFTWHLERRLGGCDIYFYPLPDKDYTVTLWGKFARDLFTENDYDFDLDSIYEPYYIQYLKYAVASHLCHDFNIQFSPDKQRELETLEGKLNPVSPMDLHTKKISSLGRRGGLGWGQINIGRGWTVP
jgi:hypothetical protein